MATIQTEHLNVSLPNNSLFEEPSQNFASYPAATSPAMALNQMIWEPGLPNLFTWPLHWGLQIYWNRVQCLLKS